MRNKSKSLSLILSFVFCLASLAFGQSETGQITGTVVDVNGAVVAGASVTATSTKTGFSRSTTTNGDGSYTLSNLQPSTYEISVKSGNFQEFKVTKDVNVASDVVVNAALSATGIQTTVDVVAGGSGLAEVNTTDQTVSTVVTNRQIEALPTITRNPYDFITTAGNVSTGDNGGRGLGVAINGQRSASTSILLNGGENVDTFTATAGQTVPLDSVQEFRILTGTFTADFGRATGGVVNLVTKSGQNKFFGSAYVFNRNSQFASAGFDNNSRITAADRTNGVLARQHFNRNEFGGSIGGPIIKNKLLFFHNTELRRTRSTGSLTAFVPSAGSIAASAPATQAFFAGYSLASTPTGRTAGLPDVGTGSCTATIPGVRCFIFNEVRYSVPNDTGAGTPEDGIQSVSRIDWNVSNNLQIYGVYSLERRTFALGSNADSPYKGFNTGSLIDNTNVQIAGTYSLGSNLVGTSRFTFNKLASEQPLGDQPSGPTLYARAAVTRISGVPIAFPGYLPFSPGSAIPFGGPQKVFNASQEFNWNLGNHLLKLGGQYYKILDNRAFGAYQNAVETLANNNSTTTAIQNLFNGVISQFDGAINPKGAFPGQNVTLPVSFPQFSRNNRYDEFAVFGMDSFKLFPNFTANVGLRYEYYGPQRNSDPKLDSNFYFGGDGTLSPANVRSGSVQLAPNSPVKDLWKKDKNNFAPSIGFAYDIEGNGKSALRAGYALRYERNFGNVTFNVIQNPPNYAVVQIAGTQPITLSNSGPLSGSSGTVQLPATSLRAVDPNIVNAFAHQYSAAYERRFGQFLASATFSGTTGKKLYSIANINRRGSGLALLGSPDTSCATFTAAGFRSDRLKCQFGNINYRGNGGYSSYQGVTFSLESGNLFGSGLAMATRYTFSQAKDNLSTTFSETGNAFNLGFLDAYNPSLDYGFADFDVRHRFVSSFVWDVPTQKIFKDGIAKKILGGWTLGGVITARSGDPFTVYDCGGNTVTVCYRLIPTGNVPFTGKRGADTGAANTFSYINLSNQSSVVLPGSATDIFPGENGNLPDNMTARNAFRGPGIWNADLSLAKKFYFTERVNLQFRVDAQNVFNHANTFINKAETDISADDKVTAFKDGRRQLQFGLKLVF